MERAKRQERMIDFIKFLWINKPFTATTNEIAISYGYAHGNVHKALSRLEFLMPEFIQKSFDRHEWYGLDPKNIQTMSGAIELYKKRSVQKRKKTVKKHIKQTKKSYTNQMNFDFKNMLVPITVKNNLQNKIKIDIEKTIQDIFSNVKINVTFV